MRHVRHRQRGRCPEDDLGKKREVPHISWWPGLRLGPSDCYVTERLLGDGATGRVLGCRDTFSGSFVAVKVAKATSRQQRHARVEERVLRRLDAFNVRCKEKSYVRLLDAFVQPLQGLCLVFEPLALSLRELLRNTGGGGLLLADVKLVARQVLGCLGLLHAAGLAHADLKCTNLMLRDGRFDLTRHPRHMSAQVPRLRRPFEVVVIDFGGAVEVPSPAGGPRPGARHIRAPEVVLGLPWGAKADMWSLGCTLHVLYTGERLFQVHNDTEHLACMEQLLQQPVPSDMLRAASRRAKDRGGVVYDEYGRLSWSGFASAERAIAKVRSLQPLREQILPRHDSFLALLEVLLELRPEARPSADGALRASFFTAYELCE